MMVIGTILVFLLLVLLIFFFLKQLWTQRHLPPGPLALPFIGTFLAVGLWLREDYFHKPAKRYGNIYSLWYGHQLMIMLSGFKAVKEGMTSFPEEFSVRVETFLNVFGKGKDLRSVLLDPEQWETPEKFNPNHFLDNDGKFIDREEFLPFGIGLRVCVGQQLARIEIFILLTSLLSTFSFRLPEGGKKFNEAPVAKISMHPCPYKLCAIPTQA